jgi:hypothetical protein
MFIVTLVSKLRFGHLPCIDRVYTWWYYDEPTPSHIQTLCDDLTDTTFLWHCEGITWIADDHV